MLERVTRSICATGTSLLILVAAASGAHAGSVTAAGEPQFPTDARFRAVPVGDVSFAAGVDFEEDGRASGALEITFGSDGLSPVVVEADVTSVVLDDDGIATIHAIGVLSGAIEVFLGVPLTAVVDGDALSLEIAGSVLPLATLDPISITILDD